jgi:serine/threonine protein kinase
MSTGEIAAGRERAWGLLQKLGEGDAGEVYLVESLLDKQTAILKRPRRSAFTSDVVRQASQIEREARILNALAGLDLSAVSLNIPRLLDQGKTGTEFTERFFIVISKAPGITLSLLARLSHLGTLDAFQKGLIPIESSPIERTYLEKLSVSIEIPSLILIRALSATIELLERIHSYEINTLNTHQYGVIWNDVKPEHLFWEPTTSCFTAIDWGNSQFLEADGATTDRQNSRIDDYVQLLSEMGQFIADFAPKLYERLEWPTSVTPKNAYSTGVLPLKERVNQQLQSGLSALAQVRQKENDLVQIVEPTYERFSIISDVHDQIISFGEIPDYTGAEKLFLRLAQSLVAEKKWYEFRLLCQQADSIHSINADKWHLLEQIVEQELISSTMQSIVQSALDDDWPMVLWELNIALPHISNNISLSTLNDEIRRIYLHVSPETLTPLVALNRLIHALQAASQASISSQSSKIIPLSTGETGNQSPKISLDKRLLHNLKDHVIKHWTELEPDPPDSGLEYREIERFIGVINELVPASAQTLYFALDQPKAQVKIVLDAWNRQDFEIARRGLRNVLIWDPDRQRVLLADQAIKDAPNWLEKVRRGPGKDEPLQDYVTRLELEGRELRNHVGQAIWLDSILEAFSKLRKNTEPTAVMMEHAELRTDLAWLLELDPHRPMIASPNKQIKLEREPDQPAVSMLRGVKEGLLGEKEGIILGEPLDTWVPEARGSSARVFLGYLNGINHQPRQVSVKLMRSDRLDYALPLFREEAQVLTSLRDIPGITGLLELGFIQLSSGVELPTDERHIPANSLTGKVLRFGPDSVHNFLMELSSRIGQGWLPYLATVKRERAENLLLLCDTGYTRGHFLPILDGLCMAIQICEILEKAHARNIAYRDHKILHYYWQEEQNGIFMIDWNIARHYSEGLSQSEAQFDLVQFGARALHYILTGRPAPGALPLGPTRPDEIEAAARSYSVQWTYDDLRLPKELKDILERVLSGSYSEAKRLREDLIQEYHKLYEMVFIT